MPNSASINTACGGCAGAAAAGAGLLAAARRTGFADNFFGAVTDFFRERFLLAIVSPVAAVRDAR